MRTVVVPAKRLHGSRSVSNASAPDLIVLLIVFIIDLMFDCYAFIVCFLLCSPGGGCATPRVAPGKLFDTAFPKPWFIKLSLHSSMRISRAKCANKILRNSSLRNPRIRNQKPREIISLSFPSLTFCLKCMARLNCRRLWSSISVGLFRAYAYHFNGGIEECLQKACVHSLVMAFTHQCGFRDGKAPLTSLGQS